jgi:hypothetical protein
MIKLKKTYYAIGQGCFYSEQIYFKNEIKTIVYDCGSLDTDRLNKEIKQSGLSKIDYLIISHFHKDHINGIEKLKATFEIENVIIPKIDALDVAFYLGSGNTVEEILINPTGFWGETNIYTIIPNSEVQEFDSIDNLPKEITHASQFPILKINNNILWVLKFYVDKRVFLNSRLSETGKQLIENTNKITDYKANKTYLKKVYQKLSNKDVNLTSMSMISSPKENHWLYGKDSSISFMNGDILLNSEDKIKTIVKHFSEFGNNSIDFHIPHHGCHKNLNRPINEWIINKGIVMSGYDNKYGHPSGIIMRKFSDSRISVKSLTQFDNNYLKTLRY